VQVQQPLCEVKERSVKGEPIAVAAVLALQSPQGQRIGRGWGGENRCWGSDFRTKIFRTVLFRDLC